MNRSMVTTSEIRNGPSPRGGGVCPARLENSFRPSGSSPSRLHLCDKRRPRGDRDGAAPPAWGGRSDFDPRLSPRRAAGWPRGGVQTCCQPSRDARPSAALPGGGWEAAGIQRANRRRPSAMHRTTRTQDGESVNSRSARSAGSSTKRRGAVRQHARSPSPRCLPGVRRAMFRQRHPRRPGTRGRVRFRGAAPALGRGAGAYAR